MATKTDNKVGQEPEKVENSTVGQEPEKTEETTIVENDAIVVNEEAIVDEKELSEEETIEVKAPEVIIEKNETSSKTNKKYKALVSFSGQITMSKGAVREINNKALVNDLLKAGYIEEVK